MGRARARGPRRASHRAGIRARRPGFPRAWAPRSSIGASERARPVWLPSADAKFHVNAPVAAGRSGSPVFDSRRRRSDSGWSGRGTAQLVLAPADFARLGPMAGEAGVVSQRLLIFRTGRVGLNRVVLGACAARERSENQRQNHECSAHRHWPHPRSVAPVFFETSATILAIAASISASVSVRSRGCNVTLIAIDFAPSGRPWP